MAALFVLLPLQAAETGPPFEDETFRYNINWPSGLPLGESTLEAKKVKSSEGGEERWEFSFSLNAAVPGFEAVDLHRSIATLSLCSLEFEKKFAHGKREAHERVTFDPEGRMAERETLGGGGKSQIEVPACAKDALTFLFYVRRELSLGRVPPRQTVLFGAPYEVRFEYGGRQIVRVSDQQVEADRLVVFVKGKASEARFELFFAPDEARTLLMARVSLPLGSFTMELVRE